MRSMVLIKTFTVFYFHFFLFYFIHSLYLFSHIIYDEIFYFIQSLYLFSHIIYDEIWLLSWMHCDLWRNWHIVIVFGLLIGLHIQHCEFMTKTDRLSWMQCDLWRNLRSSWEVRHRSKDFLQCNQTIYGQRLNGATVTLSHGLKQMQNKQYTLHGYMSPHDRWWWSHLRCVAVSSWHMHLHGCRCRPAASSRGSEACSHPRCLPPWWQLSSSIGAPYGWSIDRSGDPAGRFCCIFLQDSDATTSYVPIVDVKSAPHAKHTASEQSWLNTRCRIRSVSVNFPWNWQRMKTVR
jgi:hypothetical protein